MSLIPLYNLDQLTNSCPSSETSTAYRKIHFKSTRFGGNFQGSSLIVNVNDLNPKTRVLAVACVQCHHQTQTAHRWKIYGHQQFWSLSQWKEHRCWCLLSGDQTVNTRRFVFVCVSRVNNPVVVILPMAAKSAREQVEEKHGRLRRNSGRKETRMNREQIANSSWYFGLTFFLRPLRATVNFRKSDTRLSSGNW